jgi:hypothetical protein
MTEEVKNEAAVAETEVSEVTTEDRAREQGWLPADEYDGDKSKWVSAETFVAKGELISKIESIGKELKSTKKAMHMLQDHHAKVKEAEFTRAVNYLKQQKKQAYESGDVDKIIEIDEQISNVKETQKQQAIVLAQQEQNEPEVHPNFTAWAEKNSWYNTDAELREASDAIGLAHAKANPNKSPEEILDFVSRKIKTSYPEKFSNPNRDKSSSVEGAGSSARTRKVSDFDMSEDEVKVMNTFVRQGIMTKDEYMKELKSIKGIK